MNPVGLLTRGQFRLPIEDSWKLLQKQVGWATIQMGIATLWLVMGLPWPAVGAGLATGLGAAITRPVALHYLPLLVLGTVVGCSLLSVVGVPVWLAAAIIAGLLIGKGWIGRAEAAMAGGAMVGLVGWAIPWQPESLLGIFGVSCLMALAAAQALIPGSLKFVPAVQVPSPLQISRTLSPMYRQPCMRAWQLDGELSVMAPDIQTREGLSEVGSWIYRLALTTQTLDTDIGRIDVEDIEVRKKALLAEAAASDDSFIRDRHQGTASHLDRLLEHRSSLVRERARASSLQDYALAYLEEARAGIAVARVLPGDQTPAQLGIVLDKLRAHAAEGGARRSAARELEIG
jgi:hypothetical protein